MKSLSRWTQRQRAVNKDGKLPADEKKMLDDIDFMWNSNDMNWLQNYDEVKKVMEELRVGHSKVDVPHIVADTNDSNRLYVRFREEWASEQRVQYVLH